MQRPRLLETKKGVRLGIITAGIIIAAALLFGMIRFLTFPPLGLKPGVQLEASYKIHGGPHHIGDLIPVQFEVAAVPGVKYRMPDLAAAGWGQLELKKSLRHSGEWRRGGRLERIGYLVTAWNVGSYVLPGCSVAYHNGNIKGIYKVRPVKLNIGSVLPPGKSKTALLKLPIKGHKGPLNIPPRYIILWLSLGVIGLFLLLGFGIQRLRQFLRERPKTIMANGTLAAPEAREPAHVIALRRLEQLERQDYVAGRAFKAYYSELSEIVREYMENRFQTKALEMTTEEFLSALADSGIFGVAQQILLRDFMTTADLVKFAKQIPPDNEPQEDLKRLRRLVRETAMIPQPGGALENNASESLALETADAPKP